MKGDPYVLSDLTHASNRILLEMEWEKGKLRKERFVAMFDVRIKNKNVQTIKLNLHSG